MENKKTSRNPFHWIGKVCKYELKHSSRILVPIYIAIIALALMTGLFIPVSSDGGFNFLRVGEKCFSKHIYVIFLSCQTLEIYCGYKKLEIKVVIEFFQFSDIILTV